MTIYTTHCETCGDILENGSPGTIVAITTTKTSSAKNTKEYWITHHGNYENTLAKARTENPRKKKFHHLRTKDDWKMWTEEFRV